MPDLHQLRTFVAVAEDLNFTRAAERLYLGQQAVSKTVRQLERELGVVLLERSTHQVRLTEAGATLLAEGREALAAADTAFELARQVDHGLAGTIRVGATAAVGLAERSEIARILRSSAPDLSVSLFDVRTGDVRETLRRRLVDVVLARTNRSKEIRSTALRSTQAVLCVPHSHPLAAAPSVRLTQIDGARLLTWSPPGTPYTDMLLARLASAGCTVEPVQSRITGGGVLTELEDIHAVALMPARWPEFEGIRQIPLQDHVTLPLLMLSLDRASSLAIQHIRAGMAAA